MAVVGFHAHRPVPTTVGEVTTPGALFFTRSQLTRSRSLQAVSNAKNTNRIRLFFIVAY